MFDELLENVELQEVEVDGENKYVLTVAYGDEVRAWRDLYSPTLSTYQGELVLKFQRK